MSNTPGKTDNNGDKKPVGESDAELNEAFSATERQIEAQEAEQEAVESKDMDTQTETPETAQSPAEVTPPPVASQDKKEKRGGGAAGVIALFLALIALGLGGYSAYYTWLGQQSNPLAGVNKQLSTLQNSMQSELASLRSAQASSEQKVQSTVAQLASGQTTATNEIESRVAASIAELSAQLGTTSEDWLIAEAEYLIRLANQRVVMEKDVAGAIALFEASDEIVRDAEGVVAFALREALANDIAALRAVAGTDVDGIYVQLGALTKQVFKLEQRQLRFSPESLGPSEVPEDATFVQRLLHITERLGARLGNLVDYRNNGEVITPILPPQEEYYLKQNLLLKIQLAQLGLLRGDQEIFAQSLSEATLWVEQHFDADSSVTISVRETLATLSVLQITQELPDVSNSLREIRKLMARFHESAERAES